MVQKVTRDPSGQGEKDGNESSSINGNANLGKGDALDDDRKEVSGVEAGPTLEEEFPDVGNTAVGVLVRENKARKREEIRQLRGPPTGEVVPQIVASIGKKVVGDDVHSSEPADGLQDVQ